MAIDPDVTAEAHYPDGKLVLNWDLVEPDGEEPKSQDNGDHGSNGEQEMDG
jgi:hypothetical protein